MAIKFGVEAAGQIARVVRAFENSDQADSAAARKGLLRQPLHDAILITDLASTANPLTAPSSAKAVILRQALLFLGSTPGANVLVPNTNLILDVVGRSVSRYPGPGTMCQIGWVNGEWRLIESDCAASEEGIQIVVLINAILLGSGGLGSGGLGGGTLGGPSGP